LTPSALRALAARHGVVPRKSLGQNFLIEPALARRIVELADIGPGDRVLEIGAGLGSLTMALAASGARVVAVERDRRLLPALDEAVGGCERVSVVSADAVRADWLALLEGEPWTVVANLPYNVAVPVVMRLLVEEPRVRRLVVMVQREVGERLAAAPGHQQFGAVSLRVAYHAEARVVRRVPASVFWPRPNVESVLVSLTRRDRPPVDVDPAALWWVVSAAFQQRRKTIRSALVRLGLDRGAATEVLSACAIEPNRRPEELGLAEFACLAARAVVPGHSPPEGGEAP
jgi:16S rRNA (adenine1518-N6/adenine1519-N6)-dimethyltransferase